MSDMSEKKMRSGHKHKPVVAIVQQENEYKAVEVTQDGLGAAVVWTRSTLASQKRLADFAGECGLGVGAAVPCGPSGDRAAVAGVDSTGIVFYRFEVPAVKEQELASMVRLQAEARLPLPADKMEMAWRLGAVRNGQVNVTVASARKERLEGFIGEVRSFAPTRILLNCEGLVKVWRMYFSGNDEPAVVVSIGERHIQVCLAEQGRLVNAVSLDMGTQDFSSAYGLVEERDVFDRFAQDMTSILGFFGCAKPSDIPVYVLSGGDAMITEVVGCLAGAGLRAVEALPETEKLAEEGRLSASDLYEYRAAIGVASMVADGDEDALDIFENLYLLAGRKVRRPWYYSLKVSVAAAAVMALLTAGVFYWADVAADKRLGTLAEKASFKELLERQRLIKAVATQRPDLLEVLSELNSVESQGIMLNSFEFVRGQRITIRGQSPGLDQPFSFEKALQGKKSIQEPRAGSPSKDAKGDKYEFSLTFDHGMFTKKTGRR
jgi:hypothetical protein